MAQNGEQRSASPILKAGVREVLVPVVVTDKSGHYVTGLSRDDFIIFEDGVLQKIVAFSRSSVATPVVQPADLPAGHAPAISPSVVRNDSPKQTYLICLDNLHSSFEDFAQVRKALKKFFAEEQAGDSQYALIALGWKLHVVVDSTRDPATILSAIGSKALLKTIQDSDARNLATETDRFVGLVGFWCGNCDCAHPTRDLTGPGGGIGCPALKGQVEADLFSFSERASTLNENFLRQLKQLVSAMSTMPTRRTVVFLSDGFNRFPGQELYSILKAYGVNGLNLKFDAHDLQPELEGILRLAVRYDVRFYTIDSRGLYTSAEVPGTGLGADSPGAPSSVVHEEMSVAWFNGDAMSQLAKQTGGQFFENSNDLLKGIRRAFADSREEYTIAYVPSNTKVDAKFRRITVKLNDRKLQIAAKAGYWATP
jgi:VWFA-related protein